MSTTTTQVVNIDPEIMGGTPVFQGTRVPVQTLIDYLKAGDSLADFFEDFPSVQPEQARQFLGDATEQLIAKVRLS